MVQKIFDSYFKTLHNYYYWKWLSGGIYLGNKTFLTSSIK